MQKTSINETIEVTYLIYLNNDLLWIFFELSVFKNCLFKQRENRDQIQVYPTHNIFS